MCPFVYVCVRVRKCVCLSTGQGESTVATGARCDDRRSLDLKIAYCSQHRETEDERERERESRKGRKYRGKTK